jgi:hypothetical protein
MAMSGTPLLAVGLRAASTAPSVIMSVAAARRMSHPTRIPLPMEKAACVRDR